MKLNNGFVHQTEQYAIQRLGTQNMVANILLCLDSIPYFLKCVYTLSLFFNIFSTINSFIFLYFFTAWDNLDKVIRGNRIDAILVKFVSKMALFRQSKMVLHMYMSSLHPVVNNNLCLCKLSQTKREIMPDTTKTTLCWQSHL